MSDTPQIFEKFSKIRGRSDKGSKKAILDKLEIKILSKFRWGIGELGGTTMGFKVFFSFGSFIYFAINALKFLWRFFIYKLIHIKIFWSNVGDILKKL